MTDVQQSASRFTDVQLEVALDDLLGPDLTLISRVTSADESTHHIEDVSVSVADHPIELVCKYSTALVDPMTGHRRGVGYEAEIYSRALPDPDLITPVFHGMVPVDDGVECLVLEHVDGDSLKLSADRDLVQLSGELGRFHSRGVGSLPPTHNVFNRTFFARMMSEMERFPGVTARLERFGSTVVEVLSNAPRALIHGGLAPHDVLVDVDGPVVIDWETAGVGPGVFDFATLTLLFRDPDLIEECEDAYWHGRGDVIPAWGGRNLAAARAIAAGLMLLEMGGEQFDPDTEALALETIGEQTSLVRS